MVAFGCSRVAARSTSTCCCASREYQDLLLCLQGGLQESKPIFLYLLLRELLKVGLLEYHRFLDRIRGGLS